MTVGEITTSFQLEGSTQRLIFMIADARYQ
jgi:hypothetical protein